MRVSTDVLDRRTGDHLLQHVGKIFQDNDGIHPGIS